MLADCFLTVINFILQCLAGIIDGLLGLLPSSPFKYVLDLETKYVGWLNFVAPVGQILATLELWTVAIGSYYLYSIILRWVKAIE